MQQGQRGKPLKTDLLYPEDTADFFISIQDNN